MDSQLFFYINAGLGALLLLWFLSARKNRGHRPTQLNLRNGNSQDSGTGRSVKETHGRKSSTRWDPRYDPPLQREFHDDNVIRNAKSLNVPFMYNGHDWDAYEVLGLPAGASLAMATERYQQLIKEADEGKLEFYEAAYQAILKKV